MIRRTTARVAVTACLLAVGCSHKPAREVSEAETELTNARQERDAARRSLEARQSQELHEARLRGASEGELAEMHARHQRERVESEGDTRKDLGEARKDRDEAQQSLDRERIETRTKLERRLVELDGKAGDARSTSAAFEPAKKSAFERAWARYEAERRDADGALRALRTSPDPEWSTWRERAQQQFDELEQAVDRLRNPE